MRIEIPRLALVVLVGAAGAGKSTFARAHFKPTQVISSDVCRALVADDERDLSATPAAFEVLHLVASLRLRRGRLTVVDAVSARPADRRPLLALAAAQHCQAVALVFDLGRALVVHGHDPVTCPRWLGRTLDLDTGCGAGGALSALRYPELELRSVPC